MSTTLGAAVRDNPEDQRIDLDTSAGPAVANYRWDGDLLVIFHTEIPLGLRGGEIGESLVRGVLGQARRRKLRVVPLCWFVRQFAEANPEYSDVMAHP
jgi:predicted GNAT family acetyltransferase